MDDFVREQREISTKNRSRYRKGTAIFWRVHFRTFPKNRVHTRTLANAASGISPPFIYMARTLHTTGARPFLRIHFRTLACLKNAACKNVHLRTFACPFQIHPSIRSKRSVATRPRTILSAPRCRNRNKTDSKRSTSRAFLFPPL